MSYLCLCTDFIFRCFRGDQHFIIFPFNFCCLIGVVCFNGVIGVSHIGTLNFDVCHDDDSVHRCTTTTNCKLHRLSYNLKKKNKYIKIKLPCTAN